MAQALERDEADISKYFTEIDRDVLKEAKDKVDKRFAEIARAATPKGQPKGASKGFSDSAASSAPGGKAGKGDKGGKKVKDGRHVHSPDRRPKGTAGNPGRSRSPRSGGQSGNWNKDWSW